MMGAFCLDFVSLFSTNFSRSSLICLPRASAFFRDSLCSIKWQEDVEQLEVLRFIMQSYLPFASER
eukprot:gene12510-8566_t